MDYNSILFVLFIFIPRCLFVIHFLVVCSPDSKSSDICIYKYYKDPRLINQMVRSL